jgi:hypothetical protein
MQKFTWILISGMAAAFLGCRQAEPVKKFEKFQYDYLIEQLQQEFSERMMATAKDDLDQLNEVNRSIPMKPRNGISMRSLAYFSTGDLIPLQAMGKKAGAGQGIRTGTWNACIMNTGTITGQPGAKIFTGMIISPCSRQKISSQGKSWILSK